MASWTHAQAFKKARRERQGWRHRRCGYPGHRVDGRAGGGGSKEGCTCGRGCVGNRERRCTRRGAFIGGGRGSCRTAGIVEAGRLVWCVFALSAEGRKPVVFGN